MITDKLVFAEPLKARIAEMHSKTPEAGLMDDIPLLDDQYRVRLWWGVHTARAVAMCRFDLADQPEQVLLWCARMSGLLISDPSEAWVRLYGLYTDHERLEVLSRFRTVLLRRQDQGVVHLSAVKDHQTETAGFGLTGLLGALQWVAGEAVTELVMQVDGFMLDMVKAFDQCAQNVEHVY